MDNHLTPEGLEKLKKELNDLKTVKRKEVAEKLKYAISFGDLSENAAYHEAKEEQSFLEGRILELESLIRDAKIVRKEGKTGWVQIGSTVTLKFNGDTEEFQIVGAAESNPFEKKISCDSPVGKAIMNKPEGAIIEIETPQGKIKSKIIKID